MEWKKLKNYSSNEIYAGCVLKVPTKRPYDGSWYMDPVVDFLVFEAYAMVDGAGMGLMVISGSKAGKVNTIFSSECFSPGTRGLSKQWLIENWNKYFYPDGCCDEAWIAELDPQCKLPDGTIWTIPDQNNI